MYSKLAIQMHPMLSIKTTYSREQSPFWGAKIFSAI